MVKTSVRVIRAVGLMEQVLVEVAVVHRLASPELSVRSTHLGIGRLDPSDVREGAQETRDLRFLEICTID